MLDSPERLTKFQEDQQEQISQARRGEMMG